MRKMIILVVLALCVGGAGIFIYMKQRPVPTDRNAVGQVSILAGAGAPGVDDGSSRSARFSDPFGVVLDREGRVLVADGGESNRIRRIQTDGSVDTVTGTVEGFADGPASSCAFNTPSGLALDDDGNLIIADTSNNRIRRMTPEGEVVTIAGSGQRGYTDGPAEFARFDGPIGVGVDRDGTVFVTDTYNDRIRSISPDGLVTTVAGQGRPGFRDGPSREALFDTPCGVVVDREGSILVADTGNHAIRKISPHGEVTTIAGGEPGRADGGGREARFNFPTGIAITHDGFLFVTDSGSGRIRRITPEGDVTTVAGSTPGFSDGTGHRARFNSPAGIAVDRKGNLYVADGQNYLVRRITPVSPEFVSSPVDPDSRPWIQPVTETDRLDPGSPIPRLDMALMELSSPFPWPLNPTLQWHEVTGVVGEARGTPEGIALHHLHSGLDIRGTMGDPVSATIDEKVSNPIPTWDFDRMNEGIQIGLMSYIHIRVGRNADGAISAADTFTPTVNKSGEATGVRVRRGTRFRVGDFLGTVNRLYHVHLTFGPWYAQANPLQFPFAGLKDSIPPTIEPEGVQIVTQSGESFEPDRNGRLQVSGDVDIIVTAYDLMDGNARFRCLGLYKLGYQIVRPDGIPVEGYENPVFNIEFNRLPPSDDAVFLVYAPGSGLSASGTPTKFKYIVTNRVRDGEARDGFLRTSLLAPGDYLLKIIAEDFTGNRAAGKATELNFTVSN